MKAQYMEMAAAQQKHVLLVLWLLQQQGLLLLLLALQPPMLPVLVLRLLCWLRQLQRQVAPVLQ